MFLHRLPRAMPGSPREQGRRALLCAEGARAQQSAWSRSDKVAGRAGAGLGCTLPRPGLWSGALVSLPSEEQAFSANPGVTRSSSSEGLARAPGLSSEASLESNEVTLPCPPLLAWRREGA